MLIDAEGSQLLLVDLQEKMMPAIADEAAIERGGHTAVQGTEHRALQMRHER